MTTLPATLASLPPRCWELNPTELRAMGVLDDYDIRIHALAERDWDDRACREWATLHCLSPERAAELRRGMQERRKIVWGEHFEA